MLTVKHINIRGDERVLEVFGVELRRGTDFTKCAGAGEPRNPQDSVTVKLDEDSLVETLFGGTVFVMNRHGSTVARYDLGASPIPLEKPEAGPASLRTAA